MRQGKFDLALHDVDTAIAFYQKRDPAWAARFRVIKARILMNRGAYGESLRLAEQPLPATLASTDAEVERRLVEGLDHSYLQDLARADESLMAAEQLSSTFDSTQRGAVLQSRGMLEVDRKDYAKATVAFRAAGIFGREHNLPRTELDAAANLGNVAMFEEHYDEAVDRFKLAVEKSKALSALDAESRSLGNLGWSYQVVGDFENAQISFEEAQAKAGQAGLIEDQTYWLVSLSEIEFLQGSYEEANRIGQRALALALQHDDKATLTTCLNTLSQIALATNQLDDAARYNQRAIEIEHAGQDHYGINHSQLISGRIALGRHDFASAERALQQVLSDPKAETPLRWEAHARLAEVYGARSLPAKAEREFEVAIRTLQAAQASVESNDLRLSFLSSAIAFYDAYVNFLISQHREIDALRIADRSRSQTLEATLAGAGDAANRTFAIDPQQVAKRLDATLLYYWLGGQKSWLWVISPAKTSLFPLPAGSEFETLVRSYRESFAGPTNPVEVDNGDGTKLYAKLVQPAQKLLSKNGKVVILPDGALNSLNFETVIAPASAAHHAPHYWIEDVTITTANSLALLSGTQRFSAPPQGKLLLVGDAVSASPDFPPLPGASKEIGLIEKYFQPARRIELTREKATPDAYLTSAPKQFSYVHFATHGTASRLRPLESAVILSPGGDSFKLYARDVVKQPLSAYLVTISACNGAGTKTYAGAGLVGLSWAFLRAGAHHVIAGLWEVSNASTPQLMDELYKGLSAGQDPATALRSAKLSLLRSPGNYRKPFYWAPFLLYSGS